MVLLSAGLSGCAGPRGGGLPPGARPMGTVPEQETGRAVTMEQVGGFLGAGYLFTQERQTSAGLERTEHLLQERVGLGGAGSMYSPNFLLYEATGVLGPSQQWANDGTDSDYDNGKIYEAEVGARLFPKRFHPAELYYSRIEDVQPRLFLSRLESTTTTARATQSFNLEGGGLRLEAIHRELEQSSFGEEQEPFLEVTEDTVGGSGDWRLGDRQSVSASYNFQEVRQALAENSFNAHNMLGSHTLFLGGENQHQLRSRLEGVVQDGSLDQQLLRWDEMFSAKVAEKLDGDANFHFEENNTNLIDLRNIRGDAGLRHQLFDSLTSSLRVQGGELTTDGESTTDTVGGVASLGYRKNTPLGIFRANYTYFLERRWVENERGGAIDEPHQFPAIPPEEIRLLHPQIDPLSIVITDPTGLQFYLLGQDYTVSQDAGGFTTITRVFTGNIPLGGQVLVDYVFQLGSDFTLDTMNHTFRTEHEFHNGVTPYFAFNDQDQHVRDLEGPGGLQPIRERGLIGGLELRRPSWLLGSEYENRESTILPFDAVRLKGQTSMRISEHHQLTGTATQAWLFYREPDRDVSIAQVIARWRSDLQRRLSTYLDLAARYQNDSLQGESWGVGTGVGVEYRWRKLSLRVTAAHRESHGAESEFRGEELGIWLVREFGNLPPTTSSAMTRFLRQ